jgi:hypothetical protein
VGIDLQLVTDTNFGGGQNMATLTQEIATNTADTASIAKLDQKIEVTIFPVSDVDRAKEFYLKLGGG